jgi:hypothetical protein
MGQAVGGLGGYRALVGREITLESAGLAVGDLLEDRLAAISDSLAGNMPRKSAVDPRCALGPARTKERRRRELDGRHRKGVLRVVPSAEDVRLLRGGAATWWASHSSREYSHWSEAARSRFAGEFSADQLATLKAIDDRIDAMSYGGAEFQEELWHWKPINYRNWH